MESSWRPPTSSTKRRSRPGVSPCVRGCVRCWRSRKRAATARGETMGRSGTAEMRPAPPRLGKPGGEPADEHGVDDDADERRGEGGVGDGCAHVAGGARDLDEDERELPDLGEADADAGGGGGGVA